MGLQEVKSDIIKEAESKAENLEQEGEEKKEEIIKEAEEEAEKRLEEEMDQLEEKEQSYEQKKLSNARMKARKIKLRAKERYLDRAFEEFEEKLGELDEEKKKQFFQNRMDEKGFNVGKVIGNPEYREFTDQEFEEEDVQGFILVSENGDRQLNFTVPRIVENFREKYRKDVAEKLFGE